MKKTPNYKRRKKAAGRNSTQAIRTAAMVSHLTPPPGTVMAAYPAWRDRVYRGSLWTLSLVFLAVAVAIVWNNPEIAEIAVAVGVLANLWASWTFLVWVPKWRWIVRILAFVSLFGWATGLPFLLWGGMLAATAIMAAKEYHCFKFWTGRYLPWVSLAAGVAWLIGSGIPMVVLFMAVSGGWMALLWERSKMPLFEVNVEQETSS